QKPELETATMSYTDLDQLLAESDVISLHCPLLDSTRGIINSEAISQMKDEVLLINTARGELIVEADLARALNQGVVAGAALDVLAEEPPDSSNPLLTAENIIITPHIAWAAQESRQRLLNIAVENLQEFLAGNSKNIVK
ncbi:MAG: NAD(P)-dependent oxidoreductase, partial [Bacillota bacterium]